MMVESKVAGVRVFQFDSLAEYTREAGEARHVTDFYNELGVDKDGAVTRGINGDPALAGKAKAMLDGYVTTTIGDASRPVFVPAFSGSHVDVPAYLSGDPRSMRRRVRGPKATRTVRIYINACVSAGLSSKTVLRRGVTVLALLEHLQACQVAVDLYLTSDGVAENGAICQAIHIDAQPLDLSTVGFAIAHPAFFRILMHNMVTKLQGGDCSMNRMPDHKVRQAYDMAPTDVYVPFGSYDDPLIDRPEQWLKERISQLTAEGEAGL